MIAADWLSGHFGTEWLFVVSHSLHNRPLKRRRGAIEPSYIAAVMRGANVCRPASRLWASFETYGR